MPASCQSSKEQHNIYTKLKVLIAQSPNQYKNRKSKMKTRALKIKIELQEVGCAAKLWYKRQESNDRECPMCL